ncbi:2-oxoacid:acceptor oxidoreductase family protein [Patescibacteria group bacterium]|nr:2-oxoacid:acceptor oxidoreductase family protein [Patescibacteria group bacterium]
MSRVSLKIVGAQGQGVNSVGEMCAKGLKRAGYCVFGLREYMSVIKNGHSSYQLDISNEKIRSAQKKVELLVCFNHHGIKKNLHDLKAEGILLHQTLQWKFSEEDQKFIDENNISVLYLPTEDVLKKLNAKPVLGNVLIASVVWSLFGRSADELKELVREQFGHKPELLELNYVCIGEGASFLESDQPSPRLRPARKGKGKGEKICLPESSEKWKEQLLITGSQAMGLGTIHAGCRAFFGYPMTPASPLLTFIADMQSESKMLVKQAEDEITAAQMMVGAMHMGTRAATATSGGGYDLMTETISMCGVSETPAVFILAQRPGPGTGLPTWSAQGDLLMAVSAGHGEFPRLVMSVSDAGDSFSVMMDAFNYAEEFQIPVTVLTEKHIAESLFTVEQSTFNNQQSTINRGKLILDKKGLSMLKSGDRYASEAPDGISARWLPGSEAPTYCAQSYEHSADGSFDESGENAKAQMEKRMMKMAALRKVIPEPELLTNSELRIKPTSPRLRGPGNSELKEELDVLIVSWGSNKNAILDFIQKEIFITQEQAPVLSEVEGSSPASHKNTRVGYLHYTYLWPLRTEKLLELSSKAKKTILIEGNEQGQLGMLIRQECGLEFDQRILKYDGRAFNVDELFNLLALSPSPSPTSLRKATARQAGIGELR